MVNLASLQKNWNQAEKILADYEKQMGDIGHLRLARCEYLLQRDDAKAGEYIVKLGENVRRFFRCRPDTVVERAFKRRPAVRRQQTGQTIRGLACPKGLKQPGGSISAFGASGK